MPKPFRRFSFVLGMLIVLPVALLVAAAAELRHAAAAAVKRIRDRLRQTF